MGLRDIEDAVVAAAKEGKSLSEIAKELHVPQRRIRFAYYEAKAAKREAERKERWDRLKKVVYDARQSGMDDEQIRQQFNVARSNIEWLYQEEARRVKALNRDPSFKRPAGYDEAVYAAREKGKSFKEIAREVGGRGNNAYSAYERERKRRRRKLIGWPDTITITVAEFLEYGIDELGFPTRLRNAIWRSIESMRRDEIKNSHSHDWDQRYSIGDLIRYIEQSGIDSLSSLPNCGKESIEMLRQWHEQYLAWAAAQSSPR